MSFNDVAIIYVKGSADKIYFWYMSKDDEISITNNYNLIDNKKGVLLIYKKMSEKTCCQRNREVILNRANGYHESDKEKLRENARGTYRNLSEEEKARRDNMEKTDITICLK